MEGCGRVCRIRRGLDRSILGVEGNGFEIDSEPVRCLMLDGEVGSEEEEGDEGRSGEECPLSLSKSFGLGCKGERDGDEVVFITEEGVFRGAHRLSDGGGRL